MPRILKCPRCGKEAVYEGNPFRPFCSERCKLMDLGRWVSGDYRVSATPQDEEEAAPSERDEPEES